MDVGHPIRAGVITLALCGLAFGGFWLSRYEAVQIDGCGEYGKVPVLAASTAFATVCVAPPAFVFNGVEYELGCEVIHPSRIGDRIAEDGGGTRFSGARRLVGVPIRVVIVMEGGEDECQKGRLLAFGEDVTREFYDRILRRVRR